MPALPFSDRNEEMGSLSTDNSSKGESENKARDPPSAEYNQVRMNAELKASLQTIPGLTRPIRAPQ